MASFVFRVGDIVTVEGDRREVVAHRGALGLRRMQDGCVTPVNGGRLAVHLAFGTVRIVYANDTAADVGSWTKAAADYQLRRASRRSASRTPTIDGEA